jgi:glutaredoxin 3
MTSVARVEIYSSDWCPYCARAKLLLQKKGVAFEEIVVDGKPELRMQMAERAGGRSTVPQIFIDGRAIGGCDDLLALDKKGQLDPLLRGAA